jgi:RNA polymerase sigma factor (sigma-70 family)
MAMIDTPSPPATVARSAKGSTRDERLLAGIVRGEPGADRAFVRRFQHSVYGLAWAIVGDRARAEQVAVDALSRAAFGAVEYDPTRGPVTAWVLGITRQRAVEERRRHGAKPVDRSALERFWANVGQLGAGQEEGVAAVRSALSQVPDEQRRALVLAAVLGYTPREISVLEGVSQRTAETRVRAGLTMVQALLRQDGA